MMAGFNVNLKNREKEPQLRDCFYKLTIGMFVGCFLISNYCRRDRSRRKPVCSIGPWLLQLLPGVLPPVPALVSLGDRLHL